MSDGGEQSSPLGLQIHDSYQGRRLDDRSKKQLRTLSALDIRATPWFVYPVFVISVVVGGLSAPIVKALLPGSGPISLAGWRHQLSALVMLPGFVWQWSRLPKEDRQKALLPSNVGLHLFCCIGYSGHFAFFFWALDHTSISHSLFLTNMSPIFVAILAFCFGGGLLNGEMMGVALALCGAAIIGASTQADNDKTETHIGDVAGVMAAVTFGSYMYAGRRIRAWMPLFVFQFPVALGAAIILGALGVIMEGWDVSLSGEKSGIFGWTRKEYVLGTVLLAVGPGFLGQAGYSIVFRYSSALLMPSGLSVHPLLGSLVGWAIDVSPLPSMWTWIGGLVTLSGTLCVSYSGEQHKAKLDKLQDEAAQYRPPSDVEAPNDFGTKPLLQPPELES